MSLRESRTCFVRIVFSLTVVAGYALTGFNVAYALQDGSTYFLVFSLTCFVATTACLLQWRRLEPLAGDGEPAAAHDPVLDQAEAAAPPPSPPPPPQQRLHASVPARSYGVILPAHGSQCAICLQGGDDDSDDDGGGGGDASSQTTRNPERVMLPCLHAYHEACLDAWFQRKRTCPLCGRDPAAPFEPRAAQGAPREIRPLRPSE